MKSTRLPLCRAMAAFLALAALSCREQAGREDAPCATICLEIGTTVPEVPSEGSAGTRASDPDEDAISNVNLFIYDGYGLPEVHEYLTFSPAAKGSVDIPVESVSGRHCSVFAIANAGYRMPDYEMEQLLGLRFFLAYPDEYPRGIPQSAMLQGTPLEYGTKTTLRLKRLMSRISVRMDRSALDESVDFHVNSIKVGNCPRSAAIFGVSAAQGTGDIFPNGFFRDGTEVGALNSPARSGMTPYVTLYCLENLQGQSSTGGDLSTFVELGIDYSSDRYYTDGGGSLIYRFHIKNGSQEGVERNSTYRITVRPEGDGLMCEDSWRVDKSALKEYGGQPYLKIVPGGSTVDGKYYAFYYEMDRGDSMHFDLSFFPKTMKVSLREGLMEGALEDGRARYTMDADGRGFTVESLGRQCVTMMDIIPGPPLTNDDTETIVIYVR